MASSPLSGVIQEERGEERGQRREREGRTESGWEREKEGRRVTGLLKSWQKTVKKGLWVYKGGRWWENNDRRRRLCDLRWPLAGLLGRAEGNGCHRNPNVVGHPAACPVTPLPAVTSAPNTSESPLQEHRNTPAVWLPHARMAFTRADAQ